MASLIYNVLLVVIQVASGSQGPPPPAKGGTRVPGYPIDDNMWILIGAGILLGVYIVYKNSRSTNKAS